MKKAFTITLLLFSFFSIMRSQPVLMGIAERNFDRYEEAQILLREYISAAETCGEDPEQINDAKTMLSRIDNLSSAREY